MHTSIPSFSLGGLIEGDGKNAVPDESELKKWQGVVEDTCGDTSGLHFCKSVPRPAYHGVSFWEAPTGSQKPKESCQAKVQVLATEGPAAEEDIASHEGAAAAISEGATTSGDHAYTSWRDRLLKDSRRFSIDLNPRLIFSRVWHESLLIT